MAKSKAISIKCGQKLADNIWLVSIEKNRLRVIEGHEPTSEDIEKWATDWFKPGRLLSHEDSRKLLGL